MKKKMSILLVLVLVVAMSTGLGSFVASASPGNYVDIGDYHLPTTAYNGYGIVYAQTSPNATVNITLVNLQGTQLPLNYRSTVDSTGRYYCEFYISTSIKDFYALTSRAVDGSTGEELGTWKLSFYFNGAVSVEPNNYITSYNLPTSTNSGVVFGNTDIPNATVNMTLVNLNGDQLPISPAYANSTGAYRCDFDIPKVKGLYTLSSRAVDTNSGVESKSWKMPFYYDGSTSSLYFNVRTSFTPPVPNQTDINLGEPLVLCGKTSIPYAKVVVKLVDPDNRSLVGSHGYVVVNADAECNWSFSSLIPYKIGVFSLSADAYDPGTFKEVNYVPSGVLHGTYSMIFYFDGFRALYD